MPSCRDAVVAWLERLAASEDVPESVAVIRVGLYEAEAGYVVYLVGGPVYAEDDGVKTVTYEAEAALLLETAANWRDVELDVVVARRHVLRSAAAPASLFASASVLVAGFDEGELVRVF